MCGAATSATEWGRDGQQRAAQQFMRELVGVDPAGGGCESDGDPSFRGKQPAHGSPAQLPQRWLQRLPTANVNSVTT